MSLFQKKHKTSKYHLPKLTTLFGLTTAAVALVSALKRTKKEVLEEESSNA